MSSAAAAGPTVGAWPDLSARRTIGGIPVAVVSGEEAARILSDRLDRHVSTHVAFLNAHCVNLAYERSDYRACLADFMILPDGIGVDIASRMLCGRSFPENLNGTDFVPLLFASIERPLRVALVGAREGIAERAAAAFASATPRHVFLPVSHGFFADGPETEDVLSRLRSARADIVLVALGVPRQELFIARHLKDAEATVAIGVGALLDFMASEVPRAPRAVRRLRLEWVYRLAVEPRRLWRRYLVGNPRFLLHILAERRRGRAAPPDAAG